MAKEGPAPFFSSWNSVGGVPSTALFYAGDADTAEQTIWTAWWFESAATATAFPPVASLASPTFMPQLIGR